MTASRRRLPAERFTTAVAARLRATREQMGLNQSQFAELGGVKRSSQILYEGVDRYPDTRYFESLESNRIDIDTILCTVGATTTLNPTAGVLQRIFMLSAGIDDPAHPSVELFQTLCAASVGRTIPDEVDRIYQALSQFRRTTG